MKKVLSVSGHAVAAGALSLLGLALSPAVFGLLPSKVAVAVSLGGIAYQAFTGKTIQVTPTQDAKPTA